MRSGHGCGGVISAAGKRWPTTFLPSTHWSFSPASRRSRTVRVSRCSSRVVIVCMSDKMTDIDRGVKLPRSVTGSCGAWRVLSVRLRKELGPADVRQLGRYPAFYPRLSAFIRGLVGKLILTPRSLLSELIHIQPISLKKVLPRMAERPKFASQQKPLSPRSNDHPHRHR